MALERQHTKVTEIDLAYNIPAIVLGSGESRCRILVRERGRPFGWLTLRPNGSMITPGEIKAAIRKSLGHALVEQDLKKQINHEQTGSSTPAISVVVCTRDRSTQLAACLESLMQLDYPAFEIVVVDNAPSNNNTLDLAAGLPVVYVREPSPGLDWARNKGVQTARYGIVAFTDDDAKPDKHWLKTIAEVFENSEVMGASGFVAPAEMQTEAQHVFELSYRGMGHGFRRKYLRKQNLSAKQMLWASNFGIGANMAFRKELFAQVGLFDTALDVGTATNGGGDIEFFHRIVTQGHLFVYEPAMIVWHYHRKEWHALRKQIYNNGRSFGAYLIDCYNKKTVPGSVILKFFIKDWLYEWNLKNLVKRKSIPRHLTVAELQGILSSPFAYRKARKQDTRLKANASNKFQDR
jgi:GT2 family glycosyltransferase